MKTSNRIRFGVFAIALASLVIQPAQAQTAQKWQLVGLNQFFLHNPPNSFTGLYRSQGMATDGHEFFFSWQYGLERTDLAFESLQRNSNFNPVTGLTPGIPDTLLAQGLNHIGDIDYNDGIIYASLDTSSGYGNGHVALYNASDLSYTGISYELVGAPSNPHHDVASWVAVDHRRDVGYGKEWQEGNTINVYRLSDWSFSHTITLDTPLKSIQGGKVWGNWLYMSSDNATRSIYRANLLTGHVEELFQLPKPVGSLEVEGLALRKSRDGRLNMYVEMIVDPNNSNQSLADTSLNLSLYHYQLVSDDDDKFEACRPDMTRHAAQYMSKSGEWCNYELMHKASRKDGR